MTTQRAIAAFLFSAVIVAVLGVIIYTDHVSATNTVSVYILNKDVVAGAVVADGDITQQQVRGAEGEFQTAETRTLDQLTGKTRYGLAMKAHDILRADDLQASMKSVEVPITIQTDSSPNVVAGDRLDIYAYTAGQALLLGHGIPVVTAGTPTVIAVDAGSEAYWVTLTFAHTPLLATRAGGAGPPMGTTLTEPNALCGLSGIQTLCKGGLPGPGPRAAGQ